MARSNEPLPWGLFSAGGMVSAMLLPVTAAITGIALPAGWLTPDQLRAVVTHPLGRLYLFVLISLSFWHWAHRFRFALKDMGLKPLDPVLGVVFYLTALGATVCAGWLLVRL